MMKWNKVIDADLQYVKSFAVGSLSGRELYNRAMECGYSAAVRMGLRKHGVVYLRRLARKALRRRGVNV